MSAYTAILTETHGRVGLVRLNRPKALNALNGVLISELRFTFLMFVLHKTHLTNITQT